MPITRHDLETKAPELIAKMKEDLKREHDEYIRKVTKKIDKKLEEMVVENKRYIFYPVDTYYCLEEIAKLYDSYNTWIERHHSLGFWSLYISLDPRPKPKSCCVIL